MPASESSGGGASQDRRNHNTATTDDDRAAEVIVSPDVALTDPLVAVRWALSVPIPTSRHIGHQSTRCVLVAVASHVNSRGQAYPSAQTLADEIEGLTRRDVRNGLDVLERVRLLVPVVEKRQGRPTVWYLNLAGFPAKDLAGLPAKPKRVNMAGDLAGDLAGNPAPKQSEAKTSPQPPARLKELLDKMRGEGFTKDDVLRLIEISEGTATGGQDTVASPVGRMLDVPGHWSEVVKTYRAELAAEDDVRRAAEPPCSDCGKPLSDCDKANRDHTAEVACRGYNKRHGVEEAAS